MYMYACHISLNPHKNDLLHTSTQKISAKSLRGQDGIELHRKELLVSRESRDRDLQLQFSSPELLG